LRKRLVNLVFLLFVGLSVLAFGCSPNVGRNETPNDQPNNTNSAAQTEGETNSSKEIEDPSLEVTIEPQKFVPKNEFERAKFKYYQYFQANRTLIHPLFPYTGKLDKETEGRLMIFAVLNLLENAGEDGGHSKAEIDEILIKYFGQTVKNYETHATEYIPGTERIRATGWSIHGGLRPVLTKLVPEEDGSLTGHFDVYYISEMFSEEDPWGWGNLDNILLSENRGYFAKMLTHRAIINFNELTGPNGDFYLKYNTIKTQPMDNFEFASFYEDELDKRVFDSNTRFAAEEATFNGISVYTTKKQLLDKLGEPFEIIEDPGEFYLPTSTYVYGGVEYVFEGDGDTVAYIMVTHYQWKYGPRNIRIGEDFEDVLARFPQEQDYRTHPESCFYGETTYLNEGGAVYSDYEGNIDQIIIVPKETLPFMKIYFKDNKVSAYVIYGTTT